MSLRKAFSSAINQADEAFRRKIGDERLFGILPVVNTSTINILFTVILLLIISIIPQAKHLVFDSINLKDPTTTTLLICLSSSFLQIFYYITFKQYIANNEFNQGFVKMNRYVFNFLPVYLWLFYLIWSIFDGGFLCCDSLHIVAIMTVMVWLYFSVRQDKKFHENLKNPTSLLIKNTTFYLLSGYLITFTFHFIIYTFFSEDISELWIHKFVTFGNNDSEWIWFLKLLLSIVALSYIVYYWIIMFDETSRKKVHHLLLAIAFLQVISIGSISSFDVIIIYVIFIRMIFFYSRYFFRKVRISYSKAFYSKEEQKSIPIFNSPTKIITFLGTFVGIILIIAMLVFGLRFDAFLEFTRADRSIYNYVDGNKSRIRKSSLDGANDPIRIERDSIENFFGNWLSKNDSKVVYMVIGEGGGSRAGCAFFNTMSRLHPIIGNNIISVSTISGSSNGAGLYLGLRHENYDFKEEDIYMNSEILYNRDFISHSLFKLLFSDNYLSRLGFIPTCDDRNVALIKKEQYALEALMKKRGIKIPKEPFFMDSWSNLDSSINMPGFIPISFNVSKAKKALISPYTFSNENLIDLQNDVDNCLTIGQGISLSEMFPFISASASILGDNYYDGGVYDNNGFEVARLIYEKLITHSELGNRKVMIISIENSNAKENAEESNSEIDALIDATMASIFKHNTKTHLFELKNIMREIDTLIRMPITKPGSSDIILSRYLSKDDVMDIDSFAKREMAVFVPIHDEFISDEVVLKEDSMSIYFDYNSDILINEERGRLASKISNIETANKIILQGYCDSNGDYKYNEGLRDRRVKTIEDYLHLIKGINLDKISTPASSDWFGTNTSKNIREKDRRVLIKWIY